MKILYDNEIFLIQKYGGATRYFYELIRRITDYRDAEIFLFMGYFINKYGLEKYSDKFNRFKGKNIPSVPKTKFLLSVLQKFSFNEFREQSNCNLFHQTYYRSYERKQNEKKIVTVHDFTHEKYPGLFSRFDNTINNKKNAILTADGIICISNSTKKDLLELYKIEEEKIKVIYHGNSLTGTFDSFELGNKPYILFVGDRRTYKNFIIVLNLFAKHAKIKKDFELICFGGGKFSLTERKIIKELGLTDVVKHMSGSDNILANLYKHADIFIYPSLYEGFGIPLLEAMNFGCPIIASNRSSLPEIGSDAALYFEPEDIESLIEAVNKILYNSSLKNKLIDNGFKRIKFFNWDKCTEETYNFYKEIL